MADKSYKGDVGTVFLINCGTNISTATVKKLLVKKPDGTQVEWIATISGTNYLQYTTITNDLDQNGTYYLQSYIEMPSWKGRGETAIFTIYESYG